MGREFQKDMYVATKLSVIFQELDELCSSPQIQRASFSEALSMLEKGTTKLTIDSSINSQNIKKDSIGIVEHFTNSYATLIYEKVYKAANSELKELLYTYYLKYQIHNIIATLRCIAGGFQDEVRLYLIGNTIQKEHCIKAVGFSYEEALKYFSTKFKFPKSLLEYNSIETILQLETGLYKWYHEQLQDFLKEKYEGSVLQIEHNKHIDVLNKKIQLLGKEFSEFESEKFTISGGRKIKSSQNLKTEKSIEEIEELQQMFKKELYKKTKTQEFGSHMMILNYLHRVELKLQEISKLLKEKALS
ncbi:MAG: V-type ATPase subunit [Candidatus Nanoarchaeia archaeon]